MSRLLNWSWSIVISLSCIHGSTYASNSCQLEQVTDWGIDSLGLQTPAPQPLDVGRLDMAKIAPFFNNQVRFRVAVLRGDYGQAQAFWDELAAISEPSERTKQLHALHFAMEGKGLYYLDAAKAWIAAQPQSPAAKAFIGLAWAKAAHQARGYDFAQKTSRQSFALFVQRFAMARPILEELIKRNDIYALSAHISLVGPLFLLGESEKAWKSQEAAVRAAPGYGFQYFWATQYASTLWVSQAQAHQRLQWLDNLGQHLKLGELDTKVLHQAIAHMRNGMDKPTDPQTMRPYWKKRFEQAPHLFNLISWLQYERQMENWPVVEQLASQAISMNPYQTYSYFQRGWARKSMGQLDQAFSDMQAAAMLGHDEAMSEIIQGHIRGTLGFKPRDHQQMLAYCKLGAVLGLASAANCIGASYTEGFASVQKDSRLAAAWHLLGARGGNANSQHDIATLAPRLHQSATTTSASEFWMREAANQHHVYAKNKAKPAPDLAIDLDCAGKLAGQAALEQIKRMLTR
jgi:hypothetical protein